MSEVVDNPKIDLIRQDAATSFAALTELVDNELAELAPVRLYLAPIEGEWSLMESLAHIVEFMPYWGSEIEKLVANPGQPFGRVASDPIRTKAIEDHGHDPLAPTRDALDGSYVKMDGALARLKDSDLALTGTHSRYGIRGLEWYIKEFVTDHLTNHLQQLRDCLDVVKYVPITDVADIETGDDGSEPLLAEVDSQADEPAKKEK